MTKKKTRRRSRARTALQKHVRHAFRPDSRAIRDADELARHAEVSDVELAAAVVMLGFATPQTLMTSDWLDPAAQRAVLLVRGIEPLEATEVLERVIRDLHRRRIVTSPDAMVQLCNVEMSRRSLGADSRCVEPPRPHPGEPDDLFPSVVMWETQAFSEAFVAEMDVPPSRWQAASAAIFMIVSEVAERDGVPVRLERMVPAHLAERVETFNSPAGYDPISVSELFQEAAEFVQWLGNRRLLSPERAPTLTRQLRALANGSRPRMSRAR